MEYGSASAEAINLIETFWPRITGEVQSVTSVDLKSSELPLARIKKIMKLDDEVKMISAEAPILFAKASELFIQEVTVRAWLHTEENKRRTLQKNDVALAISKYDQFDFLIDIVPREEIKPSKKESNSPKSGNNNNTTLDQASTLNMPLNAIDPQTANLINVINGQNGGGNTVLATSNGNQSGGNNVQYYFALPANSNGQSQNGLPLQLQGLQTIQGIQNIQTIQGLQGLQGLQGAQIILNSNGQPTIFSVGNRDC